MSWKAGYLSTTVALAATVLVVALWPRAVDRPTPRLPVASIPAERPAALPRPPTAREILDRAEVLELRPEQIAGLRALERVWEGEARDVTGAVRDAERELSTFMKDARGSGGASVHQIRQRSAAFSELSAALREGRRRHSADALQLLDGWQRQRVARAPGTAVGRNR